MEEQLKRYRISFRHGMCSCLEKHCGERDLDKENNKPKRYRCCFGNGRGSVDGWRRVCLEKGLMSLVSVDIKNFPSSLCFSFVPSFPGLIKETDATCNCSTGIDTKRVHDN